MAYSTEAETLQLFTCPLCRQDVPEQNRQLHMAICARHNPPPEEESCPYCSLPAADPVHISACGARTDHCAACDRRVRKCDWELHVDSACAFGSTTERGHIPHENTPLMRAPPTQWSAADIALGAGAVVGAGLIGYQLLRRRRQ